MTYLRTNVLFILVLAAAVGFVADKVYVTPWLDSWNKLFLESQKADKDLQKARAILAGEKAARQGWDKVKALLDAPHLSDVQNHFFRHLEDLCNKVGVDAKDITPPTRPQQRGDFKEYIFETKFKLSWEQLVKLLVELHDSREFLKPLRLTVNSRYDREDRLDVDLKLSTIEYSQAPVKAGGK